MEFQSEQGFAMGIKNYPCSKAQMHCAMVQNTEKSCSKYSHRPKTSCFK